MKLSKTDKIILTISCPIFIAIGIPLTAIGYVAGLVCIAFGFMNLILCIIGGIK